MGPYVVKISLKWLGDLERDFPAFLPMAGASAPSLGPSPSLTNAAESSRAPLMCGGAGPRKAGDEGPCGVSSQTLTSQARSRAEPLFTTLCPPQVPSCPLCPSFWSLLQQALCGCRVRIRRFSYGPLGIPSLGESRAPLGLLAWSPIHASLGRVLGGRPHFFVMIITHGILSSPFLQVSE